MNVGVIGNGFVGNSIYHTFSPQMKVRVYDVVEAKSTDTLKDVLMESEIIFVCVPTPMLEGGSIDLSYINKVFNQCKILMTDLLIDHSKKVFVIKSTVVPHTTSKLVKRTGLRIVFSPEFLTERTAVSDSICSNHTIVGGDLYSKMEVRRLYEDRFGEAFRTYFTDSQTAEFIKYMRNTFFATKVTFMNEMFRIAANNNVDWENAVDGFVMDGRIGHSHLSVPGHDNMYGYGGTCFPKDLNALIQKSLEDDFFPTLLNAVNVANIKYRGMEDWKEDIGRAVSEVKE